MPTELSRLLLVPLGTILKLQVIFQNLTTLHADLIALHVCSKVISLIDFCVIK